MSFSDKIFNKIRDILYSEDDTYNILKMYFFLPFIFIIFVHYGALPDATGRTNIFIDFVVVAVLLSGVLIFGISGYYYIKNFNILHSKKTKKVITVK